MLNCFLLNLYLLYLIETANYILRRDRQTQILEYQPPYTYNHTDKHNIILKCHLVELVH